MSAATREDIARLFGRAAFGATEADLATWEGKPYADAVEGLLSGPGLSIRPTVDEVRRISLTMSGELGLAQRWWLERMRTTAHPLEERMVLFWHDHFATAFSPMLPKAEELMQQNETLRTHALGNFHTMCEAITLDPAMLHWLDGVDNGVNSRNENYAREFFELFTLGVTPQVYTEQDIREGARVLTGWTVDANRQARFRPMRHDTETKVVLGRTITDQGDKEYLEVVDVALEQSVAPLFVAYKMVLNFAYEPAALDLISQPDPLVAKVADGLRGTWDIKAAMRTLLLADEFRYPDMAAGRQVVRSPIEIAVHLAKAIGFSLDNQQTLNILGRMAQKPFEPPNVGGWPAGEHWLTTATTLARYDWGVIAHGLWNGQLPQLRQALPAPGDLDAWTRRVGLVKLHPNTQTLINDYLAARQGAPETELQAGVLALLAAGPDWGVI